MLQFRLLVIWSHPNNYNRTEQVDKGFDTYLGWRV